MMSLDSLLIESIVMLVFAGMVVRTQLERAQDPDFFVQRGGSQSRWLAAAFVLMAIGFSIEMRSNPLIGLELAACITLALMHPANAFCLMVFFSILRPWELDPGNPLLALMPRFVVGLCVFSWLIHPGQHAEPQKRNLRGVLYLSAFSLWLLATTVKAPELSSALAEWFDLLVKSIAGLALALFIIDSDRSVREVENTLAISALGLIGFGLNQYLTGTMTNGRLAGTGLLGDPNDLAAVIVMALPFAVRPLLRAADSGILGKVTAIAYSLSAAFVIWLSGSRGAILALFAEALAVRIVRNRGKRLGTVVLLVAGLASYLVLIRYVHRTEDDMMGSEGSRITLWKTGVNMALHHPLLGVGLGQFPANYESYVVGTVYEWGQRTAHSSWFLALGESGFVGLFLFVAFFISVSRIAWRERLRRSEQMIALVGYGVAMSFLSHTYSPYYYLLMGLIMASASVQRVDVLAETEIERPAPPPSAQSLSTRPTAEPLRRPAN